MNVKVLHEKPQAIRMGPVRSAIPTDKAPPKVASLPKAASPPKGTQSKGALTKCSPSSPPPPQKPQQQQQKPQHKTPFNSNVCFLCGKAGHYGSQTSCNAANKVRKAHFN
jgi:hypothetical protein